MFLHGSQENEEARGDNNKRNDSDDNLDWAVSCS